METSIKSYPISPAKLAVVAVLRTWQRLAEVPVASAHEIVARSPIRIGNIISYWSRGLEGTAPPFSQTTVGGTRFLLLFDEATATLAIYEKTGREWRRSALLRKEAEILAALPMRALQAEISTQPATVKQVDALRKFLGLAPTAEMPALTSIVASAMLDRLTVERAIADLREDFATWVAAREPAPSIAAYRIGVQTVQFESAALEELVGGISSPWNFIVCATKGDDSRRPALMVAWDLDYERVPIAVVVNTPLTSQNAARIFSVSAVNVVVGTNGWMANPANAGRTLAADGSYCCPHTGLTLSSTHRVTEELSHSDGLIP